MFMQIKRFFSWYKYRHRPVMSKFFSHQKFSLLSVFWTQLLSVIKETCIYDLPGDNLINPLVSVFFLMMIKYNASFVISHTVNVH
jgi:hypothetical protein